MRLLSAQRKHPPLPRWLPAAAGLLFLNGMLAFSNWWPTPAIVPDHRLAPEFLWLWLILLALVHWRGRVSAFWLQLLTAGYLLLVVGRYIDVTAPALFGRPLNLYWDAPQLPRFLWVTVPGLPWWLTAGAVVLLIGAFWALYRLLRLAIRVAARDAVPHALRSRATLVATMVAVAVVVANYAGVRATWPVIAKPVLPTYWRQSEILATAVSPERLARVLPEFTVVGEAVAAPAAGVLAGLHRQDVYLIFMESVGAVTYDHPQAKKALGAIRLRFADEIAAGGHSVVSAFVRAPTFGGGSDLSHLSLLSGIDLANPLRHDVLLTTRRPTLTTLFRREGYRVFGFYPSLSWPWPERDYYGFDEFVDGPMLGYRGPPLGHWHIPDQFAIARFEQMFPRTAATPPRFVFFPTITCHFPFSPVPPYQPDWRRLLGDRPFDDADVARARAEQPNWLDMFPDYLRMVEYTYRWLGGHLSQPEPRPTVYVLVGDHQPTANVSGEGASWDVPVHVVSRDPELLRRFVSQGFEPGMTPPRQPLGGMHDLTAMMLRAFSPGPPAADSR